MFILKAQNNRNGVERRRKASASPAEERGFVARRGNKVSDVVALDIVRDIVNRGLKAGDRLPPEAEMIAQYQVSRATLREALRLLDVQGLVRSRPGPGGGTVVGKVEVGSLGRTLTLHMHLTGATYDELLAAYVLAESITAELAAGNPDRERVKRLMQPYTGEHGHGAGQHAVSEGFDFHQTVASLADNNVLGFILQTPGAIVNDHIVASLNRQLLEDHIVHDHNLIAGAIVDGDRKRAYATMHDHTERLVEHFRAYWPKTVGEKIEWR